MISIVGRKGSKSITRLVKNSNIKRYKSNCDLLINYGLTGPKLSNFFRRFPSARGKKIVNRVIGTRTKYADVRLAAKNGVLVPDTKLTLGVFERPKFLSKPMHSQGGRNIHMATARKNVAGKYYQKFVDRKYELRVHVFSWMDESVIHKRLGSPDEVTWNYHNGGKFLTIRNQTGYKVFDEAKRISRELLGILNMDFGAVDFVVSKDNELFFIEINAAPGFENLSEPIYKKAFEELDTKNGRNRL